MAVASDWPVMLGGGHRSAVARTIGFSCPVALAFESEDALFVCNGSQTRMAPTDWAADLMEKQPVRLGLAGRSCERGSDAAGAGARLSLRRRRRLQPGAASSSRRAGGTGSSPFRSLAGRSPPFCRSCRAIRRACPSSPGGGILLALFAPRNRLIEFVLQEDAYRADMMREIDAALLDRAIPVGRAAASWSPCRTAACGRWASTSPGRRRAPMASSWSSIATFQPVASYHSRANGTRHGVTSAIAIDGAILAASRGGDCIVRHRSAMEGRR